MIALAVRVTDVAASTARFVDVGELQLAWSGGDWRLVDDGSQPPLPTGLDPALTGFVAVRGGLSMAGIGSCLSDPLGCPGQVIGGAASDAASSGLKALADGAFDFLGNVLKLLTTFWISAPAPDLTSPQSAVQLVCRPSCGRWPMFALALGLLLAAVRLMWNARAGEPGAFAQAVKGIALTVVVTGAGALVISVLMSAFDQWADHILDHGFDGDGVGEQLAELSSGASRGRPARVDVRHRAVRPCRAGLAGCSSR